jgi:3-oxoadipate enol-lactonase
VLIDGPDGRLWVERQGEGDPVTVVAHGITSSSEELAPLVTAVPGTRVLFDFRGHGRSEAPPEAAGYDYPAMRRDLAFVADRFGATRAFGASMGAGAILAILAEEPERFERVVLFIPARIDEPAPPATARSYPALADLLERYPLEEVARRHLAAPEMQPLLAARPGWRSLVERRVLRMNATGVPRALRAFADGPPPVADAEALRRVRAPALILAHEGDPIHPAEVARRLAELLPNATLRVWDEPLAMLDDPAAFASLVADFLGAPAPARPGAGRP